MFKVSHSGVKRVPMTVTPLQEFPSGVQQVWEVCSSTIMWYIWKARCTKVFEGTSTPPVESVSGIWNELILTLKGQYDMISGDTDAAIRQRLAFHGIWKKGPFYNLHQGKMVWKYIPPKWLFPPPIT